ncbi:MAG: glucose/mannose transport system permease protein [Thermotogota bacterium]|nr:glucose/mannose transport system permease protein [Thermotogota bacterium]
MLMALKDWSIFLIPLLITVGLLYGMLFWTFYVSVSNWYGTAPNYQFAGFKWYKLMFSMDRFWTDFKNNLKWLLIGVLPTLFVALLIAYLLELSNRKKLEFYIRTLILYPSAMSFIVTGTIWSWMYQPDRGVINTILDGIGLDVFKSRFTTDPKTATYWLIVIFIWQFLGLAVIILQSSFRSSELQEIIESALVDGASRMRILFQIIVPNIRGGMLILASLLLISALKVFDIVYIVTFGGPGYSTDVLAFFMFIATFQQHLVALGAGLSIIIFLMAFVIVVPYTIYAFRRWFA